MKEMTQALGLKQISKEGKYGWEPEQECPGGSKQTNKTQG